MTSGYRALTDLDGFDLRGVMPESRLGGVEWDGTAPLRAVSTHSSVGDGEESRGPVAYRGG